MMNCCVLAAICAMSLSACSSEDGACERALARLARIHAARSLPPLPARAAQLMLEECQRGKLATHDPVLHCAIDSASDEVAASCIDRFTHDVLSPQPGSAGSRHDGQGLNPLLDPSPDQTNPEQPKPDQTKR
jgi:hypothetical protein